MVPKSFFATLLGATRLVPTLVISARLLSVLSISVLLASTLSTSSGASIADEYRPGEFLTLDLSKAVLSPKPLGPPTQFEPVAVAAKSDGRSDVKSDIQPGTETDGRTDAAAATSRIGSEAAATPTKPAVTVAPVRVARRHTTVRTHVAVRTAPAHRHTSPLDAQAFDTRIQVWPCRSGGICNWQRPAN
jgi:hypothetical protein